MNYIDWIAKEGYQLREVSGQEVWSRPTKYGHPKCKDKGHLDVVLEKFADGSFGVSIEGRGRILSTNISAFDITEADLVKHGRSIEHRLVSAWMEMVA